LFPSAEGEVLKIERTELILLFSLPAVFVVDIFSFIVCHTLPRIYLSQHTSMSDFLCVIRFAGNGLCNQNFEIKNK